MVIPMVMPKAMPGVIAAAPVIKSSSSNPPSAPADNCGARGKAPYDAMPGDAPYGDMPRRAPLRRGKAGQAHAVRRSRPGRGRAALANCSAQYLHTHQNPSSFQLADISQPAYRHQPARHPATSQPVIPSSQHPSFRRKPESPYAGTTEPGRVDKSRPEQCRNCLVPFRRRFQDQIRQPVRTKAAAKAPDSGLRRNDG